MALTKAQMRDKVLRILGRLPENQIAQAWESDIVEDTIDQVQAFLESEELAFWETSAIPDGVVQGYSRYVAGQVAPELMGAEQAVQYVGLSDLGMRAIRRFCATADGPVTAVYY